MVLHQTDKVANARKQRAATGPVVSQKPATITTAAEIAFNKDFQPIVSDDGGYIQTDTQEETT